MGQDGQVATNLTGLFSDKAILVGVCLWENHHHPGNLESMGGIFIFSGLKQLYPLFLSKNGRDTTKTAMVVGYTIFWHPIFR